MKQLLITLAIALIGCQTEKPETNIDFHITVFNCDNQVDSIGFSNWKKTHLSIPDNLNKDTLFSQDTIPVGVLNYSDDQYLVYGYCAGEFGGALMFQDKDSKDSIYYLQSTCPVMIDKREDGYYVTASLAHMVGFGKVQYLKTPRELVCVHLDSLSTKWESRMFPNLTGHELWKQLENQGTVLIDTTGLTFSMFFQNNNENYLIFSDNQNTYLGRLADEKLHTIDTLVNLPTSRSNDLLNDKVNGYYHHNFKRKSSLSNGEAKITTVLSGDIYAKGNSIVIGYSNIKTTEN